MTPKDFLLAIVALVCMDQFAAAQNINYFGVAYSPYVKYGNPPWNSYSLEDIKKMLRIILTYHNSVSTYSMGVADYNVNGPWDKADSNCLVARAAAQINRERNSVVLSVSQGIYQNNNDAVQRKEIDNAFSAAEDANRIKSGTVWGLVFTNEYITDGNSGRRVLQMINDNKGRAHQRGLRVGTRIHICDQIYKEPNKQILIEIAKASDFIMCNFYPGYGTNNADAAVRQISNDYYSARDGFQKYNRNLEVIIGETGWASQGKTFNNPPQNNNINNLKEFWQKMKNWSTQQRVKVQMFEAFDEPWKTGEEGEKYFGWWKRAPDNGNYYIEKATNKVFN